MLALREVTVWPSTYQPNHTYLIDGHKMVAYIKKDTTTPIKFDDPITFDRARRKFVEVDISVFGNIVESNLIRIVGSKGDIYEVDPVAKTCTCSGFKFRGFCKHLKDYT